MDKPDIEDRREWEIRCSHPTEHLNNHQKDSRMEKTRNHMNQKRLMVGKHDSHRGLALRAEQDFNSKSFLCDAVILHNIFEAFLPIWADPERKANPGVLIHVKWSSAHEDNTCARQTI